MKLGEGGASELRGARWPVRVERARNLHPVVAALIDAGQSYGMPYLDDTNVPGTIRRRPVYSHP